MKSTRSRPGQLTGPALNGTSDQLSCARPSSQISGANRSAYGSVTGSRWKYELTITKAVPAGRSPTGRVASRRMTIVVGHSRTDSSTAAWRYGRSSGRSGSSARAR